MRVTVVLARLNKQSKGLIRVHRLIKQTCFDRFSMQRQSAEGMRVFTRLRGQGDEITLKILAGFAPFRTV
jgi:hypothetical protein